MTTEERDALLAKPLDAVLAVPRASGSPHVTPLWFHWDGQTFSFSTTRSRAKYKHIRRHPHISLLVDDLAAHHYVAAYGTAEIIEDDRDRVLALSKPIIEKYMGDRAGQMLEHMEPDRVVVLLRPEKLIER